jgi:hypothetical protein
VESVAGLIERVVFHNEKIGSTVRKMSGGQTGADRGALDFTIKHGILRGDGTRRAPRLRTALSPTGSDICFYVAMPAFAFSRT